MIRRNTAQRYFVYCVKPEGNGLETGQELLISALLSKDAGAFVATNDVHPTEVGETGVYYFNLTAAETNAASVDVVCSHSSLTYTVLPYGNERWTRLDTNVTTANGSPVYVGDLNFVVSAGGKLVNDLLDIVPGDEYSDADDTAITFTDSRFPDLDLFASAELTVYVAGVAVVDHVSTVLLDESTKTISVELTEAQTGLLLASVGEDAQYDLELVRADTTRKTVARGSANILDPLG